MPQIARAGPGEEDRDSGRPDDSAVGSAVIPQTLEQLSPPGSVASWGQGSLTHKFPAQLLTLPLPPPPPQATAPQMAPIKGLCFVSIFPK